MKKYLIILIATLLMFQGCATNLKKIPALKIESPLSKIKTITFEIKDFEDVSFKGLFTYNPKPAEAVKVAIANELIRNGHKLQK